VTWLLAVLVVGLAGLLTGMTGFGFSVLSVPLLLLVYAPPEVVVVALCLVPLTSAFLLLTPTLRGKLDWRLCLALSGCSLVGLPIGLWIFHRVDGVWVNALVGLALVAFAWYGLFSDRSWSSRGAWVVPSGVLGGILATSTGLSGPAVAMYVHGRRLSNPAQVATMSAYVGIVSILGVALLAVRGEVGAPALELVAWLAPIALVGVAVGRWWADRRHDTIDRLTLYALGLMGLWTVGRAVLGVLSPGGSV
jgi:uncharacterized membrane protein YfcA